jgi:hypothetical protein
MDVFGTETAASCVSASLNVLCGSCLLQQKRLRVVKGVQCVGQTGSMWEIYVGCLHMWDVYICGMSTYVGCLLMWDVYICGMSKYVGCLLMWDVYICGMSTNVGCLNMWDVY